MNAATITPTDNGPYLVQGNVTLIDIDGTPSHGGDTVTLCHCGHSNMKPFCDGTHEKANFAAINRCERQRSANASSAASQAACATG